MRHCAYFRNILLQEIAQFKFVDKLRVKFASKWSLRYITKCMAPKDIKVAAQSNFKELTRLLSEKEHRWTADPWFAEGLFIRVILGVIIQIGMPPFLLSGRNVIMFSTRKDGNIYVDKCMLYHFRSCLWKEWLSRKHRWETTGNLNWAFDWSWLNKSHYVLLYT